MISTADGLDGNSSLTASGIKWSVTSTGIVQGADDGVVVNGTGSVLVNAGNVTGLTDAGVDVFADDMIILNTGEIFGLAKGISLSNGHDEMKIVNTGIVSGGRGIEIESGCFDNKIINSGSILGIDPNAGGFGIELDELGTVINNSGLIGGMAGAISGSDGRDVVFNSGVMQGDVVLNGGDDVYRAAGDGEVQGNVRGGAGDDDMRGARDADNFIGGNGADTMRGGDGDDTLEGGNGRDIIYGGAGADLIEGGNAGDLMLGGAGNDEFLFTDTGDIGTTSSTRDEIRDFEQGVDVINLSAMVGPDFVFLGTGGFTGGAAPELRLAEVGGSTFVQLDYDGDGSQDGRMLVRGVTDMLETDFIL